MPKKRKLTATTRRKLQRGFALIALLGLLAAIVLVAVLDRRVTQQFEGRRWTLPARVYAQPLEMYVGQNLSAARFAQELARLGYLGQVPVDRPGSFRRKGDTVDVFVRDFRFSDDLPIGSHFAAKAGDERTLLELAYELEAAHPWASRRPSVAAS